MWLITWLLRLLVARPRIRDAALSRDHRPTFQVSMNNFDFLTSHLITEARIGAVPARLSYLTDNGRSTTQAPILEGKYNLRELFFVCRFRIRMTQAAHLDTFHYLHPGRVLGKVSSSGHPSSLDHNLTLAFLTTKPNLR
jgi:hypothetical protein